MSKTKIDRVKLSQLLRSGKTQRACSKIFNVSESAISKARKELNVNVVKSVCLENAHKVVGKSLDAVSQLQKINNEANRLLDDLEQKPELRLKIMSEIRGQLRFQLEIFQTLYDMRTVEEFQHEVLQAISEVDSDVRKRIVEKLQAHRALRQAVHWD